MKTKVLKVYSKCTPMKTLSKIKVIVCMCKQVNEDFKGLSFDSESGVTVKWETDSKIRFPARLISGIKTVLDTKDEVKLEELYQVLKDDVAVPTDDSQCIMESVLTRYDLLDDRGYIPKPTYTLY